LVISHWTILPTILDYIAIDDPSPLTPEGGDEVSVDPSLPEFNMESEMAQLNLDQTSTDGPKSNHSFGTRTLKSIYASARKTKSEEFRRHNTPPKLRSKTAVDKMRWDGHRSSYPAFASEVEGTLLMIVCPICLQRKFKKAINTWAWNTLCQIPFGKPIELDIYKWNMT
jgi:hypothetical protein